jgi:uncharacterized protein (DUF1330 family)
MPAYVIVEIEILEPVGYEEYKRQAADTVHKYGGKYIVRGGKTEVLEGDWQPKRIVILEFADVAAVKRWYNSPEYQKALPIRLANSSGRAFIVEGA